MEYIVKELRGVSSKLGQLQTILERRESMSKGREEHVVKRIKDVRGVVDEIRDDLVANRKTPNQLLAEELAIAIDEVVETTGTSLSEVLDQAKEIYDRHIEEVRDLERRKRVVNDLFKGW